MSSNHMEQLDTFEVYDLKTYKLESRPGIKDILLNFENEELSSSLHDGLRLCLNSVLHTHQKIIQTFSLLESGEEPWSQL